MSDTYHIGCTQCKTHFWIAQSSCVRPITLYSGDDEVMEGLALFLATHREHPLVFGDVGPISEGYKIGFGDDGWHAVDEHGQVIRQPWEKS